MRILVCGATGFLGSRVVARLSTGTSVPEVVATGRTLNSLHPLSFPKVRVTLGDLTDANFVETLFDHPLDAVVNCASLSSPWGKEADFVRANVLTQRHLIAAAERHGVRRFVYISSPSVYAMGGRTLAIREDDPLPGRFANAYARTKALAEGLLAESALDYVTLRPRALTGAGDTVIMPRLLRAHASGRLCVIGSGHNVVDLTPVASVVEAILLSLRGTGLSLKPALPAEALRQTYNVTNGAPVALWPAINRVVTALDMPPVTKRLPRPVAMAAATLAEGIARVRPGRPEPSITRYGVRVLSDSVTLDISKARRLLGYAPAQSLDEALDEYVAWHKTAYA